jgi:hypothetical protein
MSRWPYARGATLFACTAVAFAPGAQPTARPDGTERTFHPKCWLLESPSLGVTFVGSSNLSR